MRARLALALLVFLLVLAGCGDDLEGRIERARADVQEQIDRARDEFEERRERFGDRFRDILRDLDKVFPRADRTLPSVRSRGRNEPQTIDAFMTDVLVEVDRYWTRTFEAGGLPEPRVRYLWVAPGDVVLSACGPPADDRAAFYCPADDTIYVAQQFASDLYRGVAEGLPGEGRAAGDFAVAYVLAHEYAHNLQYELGVFDNSVGASAKPFELQADCFAGTWAHSVFEQGDLQPGDIEEASNAALAVGDFDVGNAQHHGTPQERREALLEGYRSGDPSACGRFLGAT